MTSKLTLTVNNTTIAKAKIYAKANGKSVSELVESYLERIVDENIENDKKVSKKLSGLIGSVKLPISFNEKDELNEYLDSKHL
jgi:hypothetical protein